MHHEKILFHGLDLDEIIFNSELDMNATINPQSTLFIFNCLNYKKLGCKSILVDKYRGIIRTNKETKKLINQFVAKQAIGFLGTRVMAQNQGGLPYVYGKQVIIPLAGATQHSTDWLLMNNVAGIMFTENKRNMRVLFKKFLGAPLEMDFKVNKTIVRRQLRIAGNIMLRQCKLVAELNEAFHDIKQSSVYNICIPCSDQDTDHSSLKSELDGGIYYVTEMALKGIMGKDVSEQLIEDTMKDISRKSRGII